MVGRTQIPIAKGFHRIRYWKLQSLQFLVGILKEKKRMVYTTNISGLQRKNAFLQGAA